jgi:hypothetical protein
MGGMSIAESIKCRMPETSGRGKQILLGGKDMSVAKLKEELGKIKKLAEGKKAEFWITDASMKHLGSPSLSDLIVTMFSAFSHSAGQLGRWSEPQLMWHSEDPALRFVGTRLENPGPYYFVVQMYNDPVNWLGLMTDAYMEIHKPK